MHKVNRNGHYNTKLTCETCVYNFCIFSDNQNTVLNVYSILISILWFHNTYYYTPYVLLNMRFLLAFLDHVTSDYFDNMTCDIILIDYVIDIT